ncbi:putative DD41D transposase [Trichonephila clavipes]|uniref:Putative DD41D transposase n=1 Tax=Trichonephila clavipes TaxID=2585209 RepID=A0A8X6WAC9_TRICX|nr:putative DD41D transposase [Trichonephila clavipes]
MKHVAVKSHHNATVLRIYGALLDSVRNFRCLNSTIVGVNLPIEATVGCVTPQNVPRRSDVHYHLSKELKCKIIRTSESPFLNCSTFTSYDPIERILQPSEVGNLFLANPVLLFCQVIYSQFGLAIHQNDHQARRRFVEWAQNEIAVVPDFHKRHLFSDKALFWLNGYVNKQNCRIWSETNPQVYVETPLHPEKLTVWCALWAGGIIGPYFFKNDEGHNVTVNGDRYRAMITNFFIPELNNHDVQELWFEQDGATCHTARATIDLLKDKFGDRLISRFGPVNWPPRSCDLTPLDYFLWGYVKSLVYADKPQKA